MTDEQKTITCTRCKVTLPVAKFKKKRCGNYMKQCIDCRARENAWAKVRRERNKDKFKCPHEDCDFTCSENTVLQRHNREVHAKLKPFKCGQCDLAFSTKNNLKRHIKSVHLKVKDFKCPHENCDFTCSQKSTLQNHIKAVHDKIKDFKCPDCDYACSANGTLQNHIKAVHLKVKDFKCPDCDYACSTSCHLQRHIKICTGEMNCSSGEKAVMDALDDMKIDYDYDSSFEVKSDKGRLLRWDFIIKHSNSDNLKLFIEYDGKQHYKPATFGGISKEKAQKAFEKCQRYDKIKNDYISENPDQRKLLRIKYTDFGKVKELVSNFIIEHTDWGNE